MASDTRRLDEIEVLRGVAVAGVVFHHASRAVVIFPHRILGFLSTHLDFGYGVDLFFAISGFVIARSLLPSLRMAQGTREFVTIAGGFWIRRAWRLLPSAWLWLVICLALSGSFNRSGVFGGVGANFWALVAGVFDFANVRFADAFGRYRYGASFAWWSLSLEEQFYLLLPPIAFLMGGALPLLLLFGVAVQFPLHRTLYLMTFRTDAVLLGVLLACWRDRPSFTWLGNWIARLPTVPRAALPAFLLLALGALGTGNPFWDRFMMGSIALVSAGLVYLAAQDRGLVLPDCGVRRALIWVGARSYAIYLIHIPAFFVIHEIWFRAGSPHCDSVLLAAGLAVTLGMAELNWRYVEQPLRRHGAGIAKRFIARRTQPESAPGFA